MNMTTKELLKAYEEELDLDEKLKYNDYESIGELFIFRGILLRGIVDLTQDQYDIMIKYEKVIEEYKEALIARYPQLRETINDGRVMLFQYYLQKVA